MKYMLLINAPESEEAAMSEAEMGAMMAGYGEFTQALIEADALLASDRLQPVNTARTVRVRDGETIATDGPFAETKEQFGGYYLIDVEDMAAAEAWAARIPSVVHGSVEVRPIWEMETE